MSAGAHCPQSAETAHAAGDRSCVWDGPDLTIGMATREALAFSVADDCKRHESEHDALVGQRLSVRLSPKRGARLPHYDFSSTDGLEQALHTEPPELGLPTRPNHDLFDRAATERHLDVRDDA